MVTLSDPVRARRADPLTSVGPLRPLHPLHAIFLSFLFPLFLGALISDLAYRSTMEVQWANFAAWLNAGGLAVGALALLWAFVNLFRRRLGTARTTLYFALLFLAWVTGFINALAHTKDAWAIMPEVIWWSAVSTLLALAASWVGFTGFHAGDAQ